MVEVVLEPDADGASDDGHEDEVEGVVGFEAAEDEHDDGRGQGGVEGHVDLSRGSFDGH